MRCNKRGSNKATTFWKADPSLGVVARRCDTRLREDNSACNSDMMSIVVVGREIGSGGGAFIVAIRLWWRSRTTSVHRHGHGR